MRILLVNPPCDPRTIGLRNMAKIEPLGLELLGGAVKGRHEVRLVDMEVAPRDLDRTLAEFAPDIVGVTSEIVHRTTALEVLRRVRARHPRCLTIAGGHHPTMAPDDLKATLERCFADEMWSHDGMVSAESWATAQNVVRAADILKADVAYDEIIDMQFVKSTLASGH